jgi:hypothetical protein
MLNLRRRTNLMPVLEQVAAHHVLQIIDRVDFELRRIQLGCSFDDAADPRNPILNKAAADFIQELR